MLSDQAFTVPSAPLDHTWPVKFSLLCNLKASRQEGMIFAGFHPHEAVTVQLSSFLVTAWEGRALWDEKPITEFPVEFLDVEVFQPVRAEKTEKVVLEVCYNFSNKFQVPYTPQN